MSGRLIFTRQSKQDVDNHYVIGAGVGAKTTAVRRALKRRANNSQKEGKNGQKIWAPCVGFCPLHQRAPRPLSQRPLSQQQLPQYEIQFVIETLLSASARTCFEEGCPQCQTSPMRTDSPSPVIRILLPPGFKVSSHDLVGSWNANYSADQLAAVNRLEYEQYAGLPATAGLPTATFFIDNLTTLTTQLSSPPFPELESPPLEQLPSLKGGQISTQPFQTGFAARTYASNPDGFVIAPSTALGASDAFYKGVYLIFSIQHYPDFEDDGARFGGTVAGLFIGLASKPCPVLYLQSQPGNIAIRRVR